MDKAVKDFAEERDQPAGEFSSWLRLTRRSQALKVIGAEVPCGECSGCCRSSYFIHVKPEETETLKRIPKALLFPAPGLPKGNVLMGYNEKGECPMLIENKCSIYEDRPQTCRDYDCRIFSATGIAPDEDGTRMLLAQCLRRWKFDFPHEGDHKDYSAVQAAAAFLQGHRDCFPPGALPANPAQLAMLAIRIYEVFFKLNEASADIGHMPPDSDIAKAVMEAVQTLEVGSRSVDARPSR
jgi:Fe-S-cluster containining protein